MLQKQVRYSNWKVIVRLALTGALGAVLYGCGNLPEPYAPPPQRPDFQVPPGTVRVINMSDADAERHFVRDIAPALEGNTWRWTGKRPAIRVYVVSNQSVFYFMDFAIAGSTLEQTGPVTVSFFVNDRLLDRQRYSAPGRQRFEKVIPAEWIEPNGYAILGAEIDKVWTPPKPDSPPLGFILVALGMELK